MNLRLPPLRERPGDVITLCEHFVKKYSAANGMPEKPISAEAKRRLIAHRWPGNVRELENAMHRAVLLSPGARSRSSPSACRTASPRPRAWTSAVARGAQMAADAVSRTFVGSTVAEVEQQLIIDTLEHCLGNRTHAANILGISIRTLRNKLKEYSDAGVSVPPPQGGVARRLIASVHGPAPATIGPAPDMANFG